MKTLTQILIEVNQIHHYYLVVNTKQNGNPASWPISLVIFGGHAHCPHKI